METYRPAITFQGHECGLPYVVRAENADEAREFLAEEMAISERRAANPERIRADRALWLAQGQRVMVVE
jgi:hypothetical protein